MKRLYLYLTILLCFALVTPSYAGQGNGAPSGPHYNLNIIGVPKDKSADLTDSNRHVIFVPLEGKCKILLSAGDDYLVLDGNATKGPAKFQLPNPDPDNDGMTEYSVYARALGKPGGSAAMSTCAYDTDGNEWCSWYSLLLVRDTKNDKKNLFMNASKELLYVYVDLDDDGTNERYPLFSDALEGYFWDYDNNRLKLAQFRFYPVGTTVPDP